MCFKSLFRLMTGSFSKDLAKIFVTLMKLVRARGTHRRGRTADEKGAEPPLSAS